MTATITIPARFSGPPGAANGGYTGGRVGAHVRSDVVRVALTKPTPLETALVVEAEGPATLLQGPDGMVARAEPGTLHEAPPTAVDPGVARSASGRYRGWQGHPFPGCFVCGTGRAVGDGLRLFAGPVNDGSAGEVLVACTWEPEPSLADPARPGQVAAEYVWAALDCPGGWSSDIESRPLVLGTMTVQITAAVGVGARCVVVGQHRETVGRKTFAATALYAPDGTLLARAEQVWIEIDPALFGRLRG
jgi:hypothetical protein